MAEQHPSRNHQQAVEADLRRKYERAGLEPDLIERLLGDDLADEDELAADDDYPRAA